jgi:hypothetical protein
MLSQQPLDRRLAQLACFGRRGSDSPELEKPRRGKVVGELLHLRIIPPELLTHAVAQPALFLLQLFRKARPRAQFNEPGISNMQAPEQTPISPNTISQDVGVPAIVLGPGDAEPVAQAVELLGVDRMDDKAAINQGVDNRAMRYLDPHGNRICRPGNRE